MIQWLRLCSSNAEGSSSISGQGAKSSHAMWLSQKNEKKKLLKFLKFRANLEKLENTAVLAQHSCPATLSWRYLLTTFFGNSLL